MTHLVNLNILRLQKFLMSALVSLHSGIMYVRFAASTMFQVGLITRVIPLEQQLHNGRRW